jgi:hypothetical protein
VVVEAVKGRLEASEKHLIECWIFLVGVQARFLLSKVNPSQTHNNMYSGWGQVCLVGFGNFLVTH